MSRRILQMDTMGTSHSARHGQDTLVMDFNIKPNTEGTPLIQPPGIQREPL